MSFHPTTYSEALAKKQARDKASGKRFSTSSHTNLPIEGSNGPYAGKKRKKRHSGVRIDLADRYMSLYVRYRDNWTCQRCGTRYEVGSPGLHNSHHFGRSRESVRFSAMNCDALCHGCHAYFTANPAEHCAWKRKKLGEKAYELLTIRANLRCKKDRKLQAVVCKTLYEEEKERFESLQGMR